MTHPTVAQNAAHKMDDALGVWRASGKGSKRVHRSFSGWELRKQVNTNRWLIYKPDGSLFVTYPGSQNQSVHSLTWAKLLADEAGAQNVD